MTTLVIIARRRFMSLRAWRFLPSAAIQLEQCQAWQSNKLILDR
jgi:hypothetical protein